jgi:hypothetical protein
MAPLTAIQDVRALARLLTPTWPATLARLRASGVPRNDGDDPTVEEIEDRQQAIRNRLTELDNEFRGQAFPDDSAPSTTGSTRSSTATSSSSRSCGPPGPRPRHRRCGASRRARSRARTSTRRAPRRGDDVWDYSHVRGAVSPEGQRTMLRDQAMRAVERSRSRTRTPTRRAARATSRRCFSATTTRARSRVASSTPATRCTSGRSAVSSRAPR